MTVPFGAVARMARTSAATLLFTGNAAGAPPSGSRQLLDARAPTAAVPGGEIHFHVAVAPALQAPPIVERRAPQIGVEKDTGRVHDAAKPRFGEISARGPQRRHERLERRHVTTLASGSQQRSGFTYPYSMGDVFRFRGHGTNELIDGRQTCAGLRRVHAPGSAALGMNHAAATTETS